MKKLIILFTILSLMIICSNLTLANGTEKIYVSQIITYEKGSISFLDTKLIQTVESIDKKEFSGNYTLKVFSFKNEILYESKIKFDVMIYGEPLKEWFDKEGNQIVFSNETDVVLIDKVTKVIFIPYFKTISKLRIFDENNNEIANKDISILATCNQNGVCDKKETMQLCSEDCNSKTITYKQLSFWDNFINWIKSIFGLR